MYIYILSAVSLSSNSRNLHYSSDTHLSHKQKKRKKKKEMGKEMEVVKGIDLERYMGRWYEIASFPSRFQPKDGVNTRATYTLKPDGTVNVLNETWSGGKRSYIEGSAYKADPNSDEAKLKVKFYVPPFLPIIPVVGDYWVLYLDSDYQYALIGQPSRKYLWVRLSFRSFPLLFYFLLGLCLIQEKTVFVDTGFDFLEFNNPLCC